MEIQETEVKRTTHSKNTVAKNLEAAMRTYFSSTYSNSHSSLHRIDSGSRLVPVIPLYEAYHIKKSLICAQDIKLERIIVMANSNNSIQRSCLFAVKIEEKTLWPIFNIGDIAIIDADRLPINGSYLLVYFPATQQTVISKYNEQPQISDDAIIIGVICELRKYF